LKKKHYVFEVERSFDNCSQAAYLQFHISYSTRISCYYKTGSSGKCPVRGWSSPEVEAL